MNSSDVLGSIMKVSNLEKELLHEVGKELPGRYGSLSIRRNYQLLVAGCADEYKLAKWTRKLVWNYGFTSIVVNHNNYTQSAYNYCDDMGSEWVAMPTDWTRKLREHLAILNRLSKFSQVICEKVAFMIHTDAKRVVMDGTSIIVEARSGFAISHELRSKVWDMGFYTIQIMYPSDAGVSHTREEDLWKSP